jgi:hypothetical protein
LALVVLVYPHQSLEITAQILFSVLLLQLVVAVVVEAPQRVRLEVLAEVDMHLVVAVRGLRAKVIQGALVTRQPKTVAVAVAQVALALRVQEIAAEMGEQHSALPLLDNVFFMQVEAEVGYLLGLTLLV